MAANKMQFQYEITANTSQAKKALADLDKALDRLNKQQKMDMGLSQELTEAADAARLLQRELNAAMDVKTGKLNVSELAKGLAQAGSSVEQLSTKFLNAGAMGEAAFRGLAQSIVAADVPIKKMNKTLSDAMTTLKNTVKWEMSSTLVHGLEGAFSGAVSYAKNLNTSLTNIRIVTGQTVDDMVRFTKEANAAAKQLSTTTKAYADASLIYYQQGDSQELAAKKAAITIKAANSSFETSAKEMSEYLTSVWNSYQVGADELERYVDIMANLGAKTATSLEEIATSMQKVAATANTVGVSMEQVSSIIATVSSVTRESAESIGTSYKTIFARIGDLKLGKVDEDGVGLGQVSSQLDAIGVKILDETGNLREMGDIIMDLGTKWQTMNQAQKTAVAQVVAGKRQYTQLMALFENWDMFQTNMNIAKNSEGALQNMADIYAESWEAASARVQASMEGIFNQIINDQAIIKITNVFADLTNGIGGIIEGMGGFGGVLTSVGSIATSVFKDKIIVGVNDITKNLSDFKKSFDGKKGKDIFTSFFGESTALRAYKKDLVELNNELSKQSTTSEVDSFVNKNMQQVIAAKERLLNIENQLTTAEKQRYQTSINDVNIAINDVKTQSAAYEAQKKSIDKLIQSQINLEEQQEALRRSNPNETVVSDKVKQVMSERINNLFKDPDIDTESFNMSGIFKDIGEQLNDLEGKEDPLRTLLQRFRELVVVMESTADASAGLEDIEKHLDKTDVQQSLSRLIQILENFQATLKEIGANTTSIDNILDGLKNGTINVKSGLEQATSAMTSYKHAGEQVEGMTVVLTGKLGVSEKALEDIKEEAKQSATMFRRLSASMKDVGASVDKMLKGEGGPGSLGEKFAKFAQGATSAVSAFQTWSSVTKNWDGMSFSESLGSIAELVTDIATSGSLFGAAATAIGAGLGFIFGAIEKQAEETRERIQEINENITEQAEELDKSSQAADQAVKNFDEASKAWNEGSLGQNEYLTIIDEVLEALDQEHLKVYALTGDYETLYSKIHQANQERMQGEVQKAQNLITTGYNTLDESLRSYSGKQSDSLWGRNGINVDQASDFAMMKLGFSKDDNGVRAWYWDGEQKDLPELYANWENLQTSQEKWAVNFRERNNGADFTALTEYMEQFTPVFNALETWSQMSANSALSNLLNTDKLDTLDPTTIRDTIFDTIYSSLNTTEETATSHQKEMANDIAESWIANLSKDLQLGFYDAYNKEVANQSAEKTFETITGAGKLSVSEDVSLPTHWLSLNTDDNTFYNGMDPRIYEDIQKMIAYKGLANQAAKNDTTLIPSLLTQMGISEQNASDVGINLQDGQSLTEYLETASDGALNIILGNIQGYIDGVLFNTSWDLEDKYPDSGWTMENWEQKYSETIAWIDKTWQNAIDNHIDSLSKNDQLKNSINELTIDPMTGQPVISADSFIEHFTSNIEEYAKLYGQMKFDEKGNLTSESQAEIENSVFAQMEENTAYVDLMLAMVEGGIFDFKAFFERLQAFQTEKDKILAEPSIPEIDFDNTSSTDFKTLTDWGANYSKWDEDEMKQFKRMALNYGTNIGDWYTKTEGQKAQDVYNVAEKAFNKQYETIPDKSDEAGYATYLETLSQLREFATQATEGTMEDLETNFSNVQSILGTLMSLDLSKDIDETVVSAEQFSKIMGMSIKDFNSQYSTASQKQLALLQAQEKASSNYADELAIQANNWLEAVGGQDALIGDANLMQTWAILSQQVSSAQADAARSAQNVNAAYATLNDEAVAGIAAQWERANKEAEKQQQIASILSSSVNTGIISNEEAAIVGITAAEWAGYTIEVRAAKAASVTIAANNATIEALNNEKTAIAGAIEYLDKYKNAWSQHILNDGDFERALNSSFSAGDFGEGDEAIAKMKEFREAREQAIANVGSTDADKVLTEMSIILGIDKTELESQIKQVAGSGKDAVNSIFSTMSQELQEKAQDAVDAWVSAFDTIAEARKILLEGGSLIDQLAGDPQKIQELFENFDGTWEEFMQGVLSGNLDIDKLSTPEITESYLQERYAAAGVATLTGSNKERRAEARKLLEAQAEPGEIVSDDAVTAKVAQDYETAIKGLVEQGLINMSDDQIKADAMALAKGEHAMGDALLAAINEYLLQAQERIDFSEQLRAEGNKREEDAIAVREAAEIDQTEYDKQIRLQEALEAARAIKEENGDWEDIDSKNRQILEANGITGLNQVDSAATQCASALASLAEAAYNAATEEAKEAGYVQNETGEWGKYHDTMSEEQGRDLYGSNWDQYKTTLTQNTDGTYGGTFEKIDEINDPIKEAEERMKELKGTMEDLPTDLWEEEMESFGLDPDEIDELGDHIQDMAESSDELADSLKTDAEMADEVAKEIKRYDNAIESVKKNYKDWDKALKSDNAQKQAKAVKEMDKAFSDMLDLDYKSLSKDFVTNAENLELMKEAAEGSEEAYKELQERAEDDLLIQAGIDINDQEAWDKINSLQDQIHNEIDDIEIGAKIDSAPAIAAMEQLINMAGFTADQATNYLASMGVDAEVVQTEVPEPQTYMGAEAVVQERKGSWSLPLNGGSGTYSVPSITYNEVPLSTEGTKMATALKVTSAKKSSGGGFKHSQGSGGGGGKGGGGGSKPQKKEKKPHKRYQDETERYHKNNETLSRISEELDKIDKLKDRAYGNKHIDQLNAETEALKDQLEAQQALYDEAKKYEAADKVAVARYGAIFDEDGTIVNYEEVMRNIVDEYNRAVDEYNNSAQEDGDKERFEAAEKRFEDAKKSIEDYEEAIATANEAMNDMLETQNKISEIETEKIVYKLEFKTEMNERDLELLEYYQEKYSEELDKQDEAYNTILGSMLEYESNLVALGEAYDELNRKRKDGLITDADYAETMQDLQDQIIENLSELNEIQEQLVETYTNTLELAREEVEKTTDTIDSANSALQSYLDIIALSGGETDYKKMATFYDMMNQNNLTKIEIQRNHLNALLEEEDKFQDKIRSGQQLTDLEKEQYQALQEEIQDTRDTLLSSTQEALETIRATYENTINDIAQDLDDFMAGAAGSLSYLQEQYEYFQEEQERYVSTAKELYEVSKLNRDIENTLGETTSKAAKEALKALQEKINKQSELNELTEYDIEMNQLQYQLLLARIKLEEAQNAKDVVRLTRDENGNYAYRYTANQDKIDEAAQNYEDILQQINDTTVQRTSEIEQQLLNTMSNYKEKFQEIATDYTLTEEERLMKLEELNNNFSETMQYIQQQNEIATGNLTANQEAIAEHYGVNMSEITASTAGNVNETIQSMIDKTDEYIAAMNSAIFGDEGAQTAWQEYLAGIGDIEQAADLAYGDMLENAQEMGEMNGWSAEQANAVIQSLDDTLEPLESLTAAWNAHNAILEDTISEYESLAEVIQGVLAAVGEIPNTTGTGSADGTNPPRFAKGGPVNYTGLAWVDGTPGSPEYVLNPSDTQNILTAASFTHSLDSGTLSGLVDSIKSAAQAMLSMLGGFYHSVTSVHTASNTSLDQNVHITAEFPNVTDHNEIEEALLSLTNRASQFANQKK